MTIPPRITVDDLALYYDAMRGDELISHKTYRSSKKHILAFFGRDIPREIGPPRCQEYGRKRTAAGVGDGTIRRELGILSAWCHLAAHHQVIGREDLPVIDRPENPPAKDRWLTEAELCRLMDAARSMRTGDKLSRLERFLWVAIMTAARFTAIMELEWPQVDFEINVIHLNPPGRKQTRKKRPSVPMSDELTIVLKQAFEERQNDRVLENKRDLRGEIGRCIIKSGLAGVTPNVLRHTAATHMARRGVPLWIIAKVLGNTLAVVERNYAHHCPDDAREGVRHIPSPVAKEK